MPVSDLDIWRSANLLIKAHGEDAATEAKRLYGACRDCNDIEGAAVWHRIIAALSGLTALQPTEAAPSDRIESHQDLGASRSTKAGG